MTRSSTSRTWRPLARLADLGTGGPAVFAIATIAGPSGGLATFCFRQAIAGLQWLFTGHTGGGLVSMARELSAPWRIALPTPGGVAAGPAWVAALSSPVPAAHRSGRSRRSSR